MRAGGVLFVLVTYVTFMYKLIYRPSQLRSVLVYGVSCKSTRTIPSKIHQSRSTIA
jgi:hypothetical protein